MRKSKFSEAQIVTALRQVETGTPVSEISRKFGISQATFFRWRKTYGSLGVPEVRELRQLREENRRLKQLVADLSLDKTILKEALTKNGEARRAASSRRLGSCLVSDVRTAGIFASFFTPRSLRHRPDALAAQHAGKIV